MLIGNEPFAECLQRIQEVIDHGCEPHVQPVMKLTALEKTPWVRHDWTAQRLADVARWANGHVWRTASFAEYDPKMKSKDRPIYDANQGLFTFVESEHGITLAASGVQKGEVNG